MLPPLRYRLRELVSSFIYRGARLDQLVHAADAELVALFERSAQSTRYGRAWGQVFDWQGVQYGVLGTSAGVQVLEPSVGNAHGLIADARKLLAQLNQPASEFQRKKDHLNTYKLIAWADAAEGQGFDVAPGDPAMEKLIGAVLPGGGWGDYAGQAGNPDPTPTVTATALGLYALRHYKPFRTQDSCVSSLRWISDAVSGVRGWRPSELQQPTILALGLLALESYLDTDVSKQVPQYPAAVKHARHVLTHWIRYRPAEFICEQFRHDFLEAGPYKRIGDFMAFMPDCAVALAFLEGPGLKGARRRVYARRVVRVVSRELLAHRFHPRNASQRATVDHLWAARVLRAYLAASSAGHLRSRRVKALRAVWFWLILLAATLAAAGCTYLAFKFDGGLREALFVVAAIAAASVPVLLAERIRGG